MRLHIPSRDCDNEEGIYAVTAHTVTVEKIAWYVASTFCSWTVGQWLGSKTGLKYLS